MHASTLRSPGLVLPALLLLGFKTGETEANKEQQLVVGQCSHSPEYDIRRYRRTTCAEPLIFAGSDLVPWTHPVSCINLGLGQNAQQCLFTSAYFGGLHGTSLITSPETATDLVAAEALDDRPSYGSSGNRSFVAGPIVNPEGPAYEVESVSGKGMGMVAARKIRQGEIILLDLPALLASEKMLKDAKSNLRRRLLKRAISQLPESTQKKVYSLTRTSGGDVIDDILGTNTVSVVMTDGETHMGLFPEVAVSSLRSDLIPPIHQCFANSQSLIITTENQSCM
jgi:hypothetical protein